MESLCLSFLFLITVATSIECMSLSSNVSGPNQGDTANISCPNQYTLLSCGFKTESVEAFTEFDGSYIIGDICYARNGEDYRAPGGVIAIARCCDLSHFNSLSCTTYKSSKSNNGDDEETVASCQLAQEFLVGCTVSTDANDITSGIDGAYPSDPWSGDPNLISPTNNQCTAVNGANGEGVYAWATCCNINDNTVDFNCYFTSGQVSQNISGSSGNTGSLSTINCPLNQFMTSCNGYSYYQSTNQWSIENDTCIARVIDPWDEYYWTWASAICCDLTTQSPTTMPSESPTFPTALPTLSPSELPINEPTDAPSKLPSISPSSLPSIISITQPSVTPSVYSSIAPSISSTYPTHNVITTTISEAAHTKVDDDSKKENGGWSELLLSIVLGLVAVVIILIIIIVWCFYKHKINKLKSEVISVNPRVTSTSNQYTESDYNRSKENVIPFNSSNRINLSDLPEQTQYEGGIDPNITAINSFTKTGDNDIFGVAIKVRNTVNTHNNDEFDGIVTPNNKEEHKSQYHRTDSEDLYVKHNVMQTPYQQQPPPVPKNILQRYKQ